MENEENITNKEEVIKADAEEKNEVDKQEKERAAATLSYIWILSLVPYFFNKDSEFAMFHARQGVVLFLIETLLLPIYIFPLFGQALFLFFLVVSALGASKAYNGEKWQIPYIYDLSKKFKL